MIGRVSQDTCRGESVHEARSLSSVPTRSIGPNSGRSPASKVPPKSSGRSLLANHPDPKVLGGGVVDVDADAIVQGAPSLQRVRQLTSSRTISPTTKLIRRQLRLLCLIHRLDGRNPRGPSTGCLLPSKTMC